MITVVNVRAVLPGSFVYCGRRNVAHGLPQSPLANPFPLVKDTPAERERCVEQYRAWFNAKVEDGDYAIADELARLLALAMEGDLALGCWCSPKRCHCEVVRDFLQAALA